MRIIVISDLHIGAGPLEDFDPEVEQALVEFCHQIAAGDQPTEIVINGDFLDFVQAEPWQSDEFESTTKAGTPLCFTEEQSIEKLESILCAHTAAFDALADALRSTNVRRLTILPGNHDADLFWSNVRNQLSARLAPDGSEASQKIHFHLDAQYQPPTFPHLWIEHGHQRDPCNSFEIDQIPCWSSQRPPIAEDKYKKPRLVECVGTRFLLKFLNGIDEKYPFVDNVKPFSKFVKMFLVSEASRDFGPIKALVSYWALVSFVGERLTKSPKDLLGVADSPSRMIAEMQRLIGHLSNTKAETLKARLADDGFLLGNRQLKFYIEDKDNAEKVLNFLAEHPSALAEVETDNAGLLSFGDEGYLALGGGFMANETEELKKVASRLIADGFATGVVMGHTHDPVDVNSTLNYVNTGSWIRYFNQAIDGKQRSWTLLKQSAYANFPYELAYAEIGHHTAGKLVRRIFRSSGAKR